MRKYIEGDIHDKIKDLEDNSIDFIYTDPPFGTTQAVGPRFKLGRSIP